ncbi:MAG: redoxin domain-containing protein [Candidatus Solibacter usitatus]|nr:redoxin domain-containing protein [Candidatus Solibacter usitatus]
MKGYQAGIAKFEGMDTQVFGVSTDNTPSLGVFAKQTEASFPLLSDFAKRTVAKSYGVLMEERGIANRATFLVDMEGKIAYIEEGNTAVDISGAEMACSRIKKR